MNKSTKEALKAACQTEADYIEKFHMENQERLEQYPLPRIIRSDRRKRRIWKLKFRPVLAAALLSLFLLSTIAYGVTVRLIQSNVTPRDISIRINDGDTPAVETSDEEAYRLAAGHAGFPILLPKSNPDGLTLRSCDITAGKSVALTYSNDEGGELILSEELRASGKSAGGAIDTKFGSVTTMIINHFSVELYEGTREDEAGTGFYVAIWTDDEVTYMIDALGVNEKTVTHFIKNLKYTEESK